MLLERRASCEDVKIALVRALTEGINEDMTVDMEERSS